MKRTKVGFERFETAFVHTGFSMNICRVATVPFAIIHHLGSQIMAAKTRGHRVTIVAQREASLEHFAKTTGVEYLPVDIQRTFSPWSDVRSLIVLYRLFRRARFDIVHSITPKAGLLCALAGFFARVPIRLHTFTGQPWATLRGPMRFLARLGDRAILFFNTRCYADSRSQAEFLVSQGIAAPGQVDVLGQGSLSGVDTGRFDPNAWSPRKSVLKSELGIPANAKVVTFIGRLTTDKGIAELVSSFREVMNEFPGVYLLLVGPDEPARDPITPEVRSGISGNRNILRAGYTREPERYLAVTDIFCLPSHREGFGTVVIEAASMGVPTVGTAIPGLIDAVIEGETGLLVPPRDAAALASSLLKLLKDDGLRLRMGEAARSRALRLFDEKVVIPLILDEYDRFAKG